MKNCKDCDYYNNGICEHEDHIIDIPDSKKVCEGYSDFETWWDRLDDIEREEYNRFLEEL